jgi:hypothetical protein
VATIEAMPHYICSKDGVWKRGKVKPNPVLRDLRVEVDKDSYHSRNQSVPRATRTLITKGLADTGTQMVVLGAQQLAGLGIGEDDLIPGSMQIVTADDKSMKGSGMILVKITTTDTCGKEYSLTQQAYVMKDAGHLFPSRECLVDLGVIGEQFPVVGAAQRGDHGQFGAAAPPLP